MAADVSGALRVFSLACDYIRRAGLQSEVEWQRGVTIDSFGESEFLRESAWVILCSGFRESIVRRVFDYISLCFCDWESSAAIVEVESLCVTSASRTFRNEAKLNAILSIAQMVHRTGFSAVKEAVLADPIAELCRLSFIGPTTVWHLAKNLGLDVAKPDRHLVRIARQFGFGGAAQLCAALAEASGEQAKVVDLIIWRYLADNPALRDVSIKYY